MRILLASDTHGNISDLVDFLGDEEFDLLFFLGDYVRDGIEIAKRLDIPGKIVRGNGDRNVRGFSNDEIFELKGKKMFLTHGHEYGVSFGLDNIYYRAKEIGADYVFFGHTHVPIIERIDQMTIMNPGSASRPRTSDRLKSFGIIELGKELNEEIIKIK